MTPFFVYCILQNTNDLSFRLSSLNHYPLQCIFHEGVTAEHQDEQPEDL